MTTAVAKKRPTPVRRGLMEYQVANRSSRARERADIILKELRKHRGAPVPLDRLVELAGPYHLEVHYVLATLESLKMVERYEEVEGERGGRRVAYSYVPPRDRR